MKKRVRRTSGSTLARRVCREIKHCKLATMLSARYVPELRVVRIGVPTPHGSLDAAIDYPCEPKLIDRFIGKIRRHAERQAA
jgi:hypothetical protein